MAGQGISVPISLQISNLQSIVTMLQSKLSNLKVGTSGFKALQNIIATIQKDIDKLTIQTDKPFVSANQFTSADRAVNKLEEDLDKVQIAVSRIKFSDLELDPSQTAELKSFETQIESIKNSLKTVKETAKQAFLDSDVGKGWAHDHAEATTQTLSQLTTAISKEVDKQQRELDAAQEAVANYQRTLSVSKNINKFMSKSSGHQLSEATMGKELFQQIFKTNTEGEVTRFQNGGKPLLQQWLQEQFDLDSATIQSLTTGAGDAIVKAFSEIGGKVEATLKAQQLKMRNAATEQKTATDKGTTLDAAVNEKAAKLQQAQATQAQLVASNTSVSTSEAQLRAELEQTKQQLAEYKEHLAEAARTNPEWAAGNKQANAALQQLRDTLSQTNAQFLQQQRVTQSFNSMKMAIVNFMGFNQVLNITRNAVREAINHIKELDTVMNGIAIVTDMSTGDLWNQIDSYSKMAQAYGVSITGAYEVSQIYYQQGLETADVMTLTNETLKLAKISGLDYATTTDYMTTAIRGFKMEMSEASTVVDVYSNLAAHTAVSQEELAVAMSKTASSMEGVGATFEEASAMIGTMVAVTRESATNIGSAMKSIASRYGELTKDPTKLVDEEGEAMAFNKVDAALQSVGISMKTVDGQFREFTDVIVELGEKWDQLDSTQQRYIATQFAGNRQQSRFLALVSNVDLLKSNLDVAMNSEDTGTLQALKALDSIESKIEQVKVAYQQFYTTIGAESVWKGFLDVTKNVINTLNGLPKLFGKIPIGAIAAISSIISLIKNLGMDLLSTFAQTFGQSLLQGALQAQGQAQEGAQSLIGIILSTIKSKKEEFTAAGKESAQAYTQGVQQSNTSITPDKLTGQNKITYDNNQNIIDTFKTKTAQFSVTGNDLNSAYAILANQMQGLPVDILEKINTDESLAKQLLNDYIASLEKANQKLLETGNTAEQSGGKLKKFIANHKNLGQGLQSFGSALNMVAMTINTTAEGGKTWSGVLQGMASAATLAGVAVKVLDSGLKSMPWMALASGVLMAVNAISTLIVTPEERLEELENKAEELDNKAKEAKADYRTLDNSIKKLDELRETRYESAEAAEEYQNAVDELTKKFPALIGGFDEAGNIILNVTNAENVLAEARKKSQQATYDAAKAELEASKNRLNESRRKVKEIFNNMGIGAEKVFSGPTEASQKTIDAFANFADQHYYGFNKEDIDPQMIDSQIEYMIKDIATGSQDQTLWKEYLPTVKDANGLYNFSLSSYGNFLSQQKDLSPLATDILDLINTLYGNEQQTSSIAEIDAAINKFNASTGTDEIIENYNNLMELLNQLFSTEEGKQSGSQYLPIYEQLKDLSEEIDNTVTENTLYTSFKKQVISAWQQSIHANVGAWEYLKQSSNAAGMVTDFINKTIENDYNGDYEKAKEAEEVNWRQYQSTMSTFLSSLSDERLALFNSMTDDTANYSAEDIIKEFNITDISDSQDDLYDIIINYYQSGIDSIRERLTNNLAAASGKNLQYNKDTQNITGDQLTGFYEHYQQLILQSSTKVQEEYLNSILNNYSSMAESGYTQSAYEYGTAALNTFDIIRQIGGSLEKNIWSIINEKGINTISSINEIIDAINNNQDIKDEDKTNLINYFTTMSSKLISNINLEIQTATSDLLENWENTSKELSSAMSGGVSLKDADALINKAKNLGVNLDLSDFELQGDKLVLVSESFNEYYKSLVEANTKTADTWQEKINQAINLLDSYRAGQVWSYSQDERALLQSIGFDITDSTYYSGGILTTKGVQALNEAIANNQKNLNNYNTAAGIAAKQLAQKYNWSQGNYFDYAIDGTVIYDSIVDNFDQIKEKIATDKVSHFGKNTDERAMLNNIYNSYSTLISDVFSKGIENIHLDDYEGLIDVDNANLQAIIQEGSYKKLVNEYAQFAGKSIDETNDLLAQAIEKQQEKTSSEVLSKLQFINQNQFAASLSDLTELANRFDIGLGDLTKNWNQALGAYIVDITQIDAFKNFTGVENYQAIINDSINEFFSNLVKLIKSALSGSLSHADRGQLDEWVARYNEQFGTNLKLDFTETAEGLKMSEDSAIGLYSALKQVDTLQASLMFDELNKSLQESNEHYESISSIEARIAELNKEIANLPKDDKRIKQYEEELALAKQIKEVRSTSEDSGFEFMSNQIPGGQNNPLNYWKNWGEAWKALNESSKTGTMDYTSFYNIITEMGNLAEKSGAITVGAGTVLKNSQDAANLIDAAAKSLKIDANGELVVDLSNLSKLGFNFEAAGADMAASVDAGVKDFAQSQVDMLDSMISLLETIVAMESLGDLDVNNDLEISVPEILLSTDGKTLDGELDETKTWIEKYGSNYINVKNEIIDTFTDDKGDPGILAQVKAKGHTIFEILNAEEKTLQDWGIKAQDLSLLLSNLYKISQSDNFDKDRPWASFLEIFQGLDWGDLVIGANAGNHQILLSDEGNYSIDYTSDAAIEKIKQAMPEWENKGKDDITKEVQDIIDTKSAGQELDIRQNYLLHILANDIQVITDETGQTTYKVGDIPYNSWEEATAASDIFKLDSDKQIEVTTDGTAKGSIKLTSGEIEITSDGKGKVTYTYNGGQPSNSKEEAYAEAYKAMTGQDAFSTDENGTAIETTEFKTWKVKEGLTIAPTVSVNGAAVDVQNDPEVRAAIEKARNATDEEIEQMLSETGNGTYTMELDKDIVVTFNAEDITVGGKTDAAKVRAALAKQLNLDTALASTITEGIKGAFGENGIPLENLKITPQNTTVDGEVEVEPIDTATGEVVNLKVTAQNTEAEGTITDAQISAMLENATVEVSIDKETAIKDLDEVTKKAQEVEENDPQVAVSADTQAAAQQLDGIIKQLSQINSKEISIHTTYTETGTPPKMTGTSSEEKTTKEKSSNATGNIGLANAKGTLMGELGPELVVSNGRYFVAGQNGPEMVDLADDAIVFNHLQTKSLLEKGTSLGRGKVVTNERNAVAFATGNINGGPAMASASAALAALKQLRSMWQSLLGSSVKDLAGAGGGGGGGGGGNDAAKDPAFVKDLEKWYNWLQRIAVLEEKINYEEAKRNKIASDMIAHGQDYAKSLLESFNYLKEQTAVHQSLADSQQIYFNQRREQMNSASNPFSALYTFDEYGQLKYKNGALAQLSEIISRDQLTGKGTYTASEQYAILKNNGFERYMQYDSSGNEIDRSQEGWETNAIQAFWDKIDADKEEMQSLHDSIEEHKKAVLEDQEKANEILKEIEDNQISVEDKVLKAIEDTRQREIDELQKQRDAIEESANNLINGLSEQLNREKDMYSQQASQDELTRLQRQLGILQNSGGSASQIASLQKEIGQKQQDAYFEAQQRQIDTLQQASQNELERLDRQIDLMTESLEYEKENGLLWGAVYEVMAGTPEQITSFITEHDSQYWGVSPTQLTQDTRDILFEAQQFVTYRQEMKDGITGMIDAFNSYKVETEKQLEDTRKLAMDASGANSGSANKDTGGGSGGGNPGGANKPTGGKESTPKPKYWTVEVNGTPYTFTSEKYAQNFRASAQAGYGSAISAGYSMLSASEQKKKADAYVKKVGAVVPHYKAGGLANYTGPAWLDGSKSHPESVLTAAQTATLRNDILSNKPTSLLNLLTDFRDAYGSIAGANSYGTINNNAGVNIEQATVEMHVAQIANDYDASRAGEQALEKIMAIARKSQGSTRIGR